MAERPLPRPLGELLPGAPPALASLAIDHLAYDSRRVGPGGLFAAWRGGHADGHAYLAAAAAQGAAAALVEHVVPTVPLPQWQVPDVRLALARAARVLFGDPAAALRVVAVTGTNGKTTVAHLVEHILAAAGLMPGILGTLGARHGDAAWATGLTTPESVDLVASLATMRARGAAAVVLEASSQALAQRRLGGVAADVAAFLNLSQDHLDAHGDMAGYFAAKARLFDDHLKPGGRAVLAADDPYGQRLAARLPGALTFGRAGGRDVGLKSATLRADGTDLEVGTPRGPLTLSSRLCGGFNVDNVLAAVAIGVALDLPTAAIVAGVGRLAAVPGRLERVAARPGGPLVLVDYAHTPAALAAALAAVRPLAANRLLCVFGCGGERDPAKRAPMGAAAASLADWVVLTDDNPRGEPPAAIRAAVEAGLRAAGASPAPRPLPRPQRGYAVEPDRAIAIARAIAAAAEGDVVLVAGKGHEATQVGAHGAAPFSDRTVAAAALAAR